MEPTTFPTVAPEAMYLELLKLCLTRYVLQPCRAAVEEFRAECDIVEPLQTIEWTGAYWQRER